MKRTILNLADFEKQAAAILAASVEKRGEGSTMRSNGSEDAGGDEDDVPQSRGGGGGGSDDPPDDDDEDDQDDSDDDSDDDDDSSKGKKKDEDDTVDRAEYERVKRHRAAADRRKAELETENGQLKNQIAALKAEGKDGKPSEEVTERITTLETTVQSKDAEIQKLRISNAFLASNSHDWADPEDALRLADLSDVEIDDEDGSVHGLKQALDRLAKKKPHLLKAKKNDDANSSGPSGSANNGRRKGGKQKITRESLASNYPILGTTR